MKLRLVFLMCCISTSLLAQYELDYYLPDGLRFNPEIPTPAEVLGHEVGEFHITHDKLVRYMEILDEKSERVSIQIIGYTHERKPLMLVAFTSEENQKDLDKLRKDHLESIDPASNKNTVRDKPLVVNLGYSIHGNEASGVNAAPIVAYYLAACENDDLVKMLDKSVILIDPCLNPDGVTRYATWVNSHKSLTNNPDPASIEFRESSPGSRTNHYWYDLNRDWLLLQHPESQARITAFHQWKPQVLTDHHEMGGSSTFFFQPGVESRSNPIVPPSNYVLTQKIGTYHAKALDQIGSLYYTQEVFDDFYFGKGSAYPDLNGGIGILFEQASSRGHAQETAYGVLTLPFAIRNQVRTSLSSIEGAWAIRKELQYHQLNYFESALQEAEAAEVKAYVFSSPDDPKRSLMMIDILQHHDVEVKPVKNDQMIQGHLYPAGESYLIDCHQPQYRMIRALMEKITSFADSTFYDISGWTLPLAMGVNYSELDGRDLTRLQTTKVLNHVPGLKGTIERGLAEIAYIFECDPYLTPKALYELQQKGVLSKVATRPFTLTKEKGKTMSFDYGTIMIPVQAQQITGQELQSLMYKIANENGLQVHVVNTAFTIEGPDLGSGGFSFVDEPNILMLTGGRISSREAGQIWHLFDTRFMIQVTLADVGRFSSLDLTRYNTLILPSGSYSELGETGSDKLKSWIRGGGKVIALKSANSFLKTAGIISYKNQSAGKYVNDGAKFKPYSRQRKDRVGRSIPGTIFKAHLDLTHPLGYGYNSHEISMFKNSSGFIAPSSNPYANPLYYTKDPLQSGYINSQNLEGLVESVAVLSHSFGRGKVISFFDDPFFRGYFAGEHKLFMNALFFGELF
ncbi:MAG: zinc carboxypeptidase [Bacteroidetes bacterium]|nr:zinc carboxypeptidase [Bacteroidota bacterium]MBT3747807.1 zinc carboxypeptidase [Bacteroidota bacterium]MBT4401518.1 zinc carboxypeptidase [Bacteroidota bacterium]MBT4411142.1 zinc carboxypeptidase [Bacteroidota bacterium]MBT5425053.1 zinc carboxypeptidase [Bacteroidota bacterium]